LKVEGITVIKEGFSAGHVTKNDYEKTLLACHMSCDELKSEQRDKGVAAIANRPS
jgi:hypothetical protein